MCRMMPESARENPSIPGDTVEMDSSFSSEPVEG